MRNTVLTYIDRFRHDRRQRLVLGSVLLILATVVSLTVYWQLRLSGIAMTNETYCGYEEHAHTEECYEYTLVCGYEEGEAENPEITHVHTDECYLNESILICELEEGEEHTHDESCFETQLVLICGQEEATVHVHTEECYENTLICELEEHVHTVDCLVNLEADVETATDWEATLPARTGDLRTDIVNIAYSQIGYAESTANYTLAEDGVTHLGYTRYGAWYGGLYYGSEYSDWDSMFVAFCLDYAGIAEEFTYNSGAYAWSVELSPLGYYMTADIYSPSIGDVAFIDTDLDGRADVTAIVVAIDETITVIQGNYAVSDTESGETIDTVALVEYTIGETILGYADVDYTEEVEDEEVVIDDEEPEILDAEELDVSAEDLATLEFVGEDYIITVSYGEDAALPEGTELVAYEYAQDSENFLARYEEAAELYDWGDSDETDPYHGFRLFNIGLYYDGIEIEPAASVTVTVTYTGETDAASVSVTHFGDTVTETLDATLTESDDFQSVTFTADGFSEYGIMLTANAETYTVEIVNSIATDGKLTAVIYDENGDEVAYDIGYEYTWYRSKEPYLATDSTGPATAPTMGKIGTIDNYNYLVSTSTSGIGATVNENYCNVNNTNGNTYVFYYYYVTVKINGTTYTSEPAYASVEGAASYVTITNSNNTLTATLYDSNGDKIDTSSNSSISYTYTWYKSRTYEAAEGTTESDAPYANTIADTNDYVAQSETSASLTLTENDSFYFYYVIVTMKYTLTNDTTSSYTAYAKGYEDWAYAGLISSSDYTAVIVDNISSNGTFDAVLYDASGNVVDTGEGYTFTWYKSDDEYLTTSSSTIYSDQTHPSSINYSEVTDKEVLSENTINVAKDLGGLHYYYVEISDGTNTYESAIKYVQYSDQIENGGFEISSNGNEKNTPYWSTTNGYYSENHASYNGYRKIEAVDYGGTGAVSISTYGIAYTYGGSSVDNKKFVELNATEPSTLYQSVLTTPGTTLYWSLYHQSRNNGYNGNSLIPYSSDWDSYNKVYTESEVVDMVDDSDVIVTCGYTTKTDSMYIIIMSDSDAEKLLAAVDESNTSYDTQQEVIDAVAQAIAIDENIKSDSGMASSEEQGNIAGCYEGDYELTTGTSKGETIHVTLWKATTTTIKTIVTLTDSQSNAVDGTSIFTEDDGWAKYTVSGTEYYYTVTQWVQYSGSYEVPTGQYLTRFFFAANGSSSVGNFIDNVRFSLNIPYTIEYYIWDVSKGEYVLQTDEAYADSGTVLYSNIGDTVTAKYLDTFISEGYTQVGSITGTKRGGTNPDSTDFDTTMTSSMDVTLSVNYLSIYLASSDVALKKVDSADTTKTLSGVQFVMYYEVTDAGSGEKTKYYYTLDETKTVSWVVGTSYTLTTDSSGMIDFGSLDDGTYYIEETTPLAGYNTATGTITVTVSGGAVTDISYCGTETFSYALVGSETVITLGNTPGVELPETGGVSLLAVYTVGSLMILASAIGLVVRRKKI